ncbi:MAG: CotH kinase family protein [Crocinitomicaceae bacterium]
MEFPILVSLPQSQIDTANFGLESICLNLTHNYLADLTIKIVAPDGTTKVLSSGIGEDDDDMINTCFNQNASALVSTGSAPFTGIYKPMEQIGFVNNLQNPNGIWKLIVTDNYTSDEGNLLDWSITFGNAPSSYFVFEESNLPIVVISTNGNFILADTKVTADMGMIFNGPGMINHTTDPFNEYNGKIGIEYRGNYSLILPQKPFSIELRDSVGNSIDSSLLGMPAENDWLLIANYNDKSFARNALPYTLFDEMGHYSVRYRHVDVILDGEYKGIYLLTEKIKRDAGRVDIPKLDSNEISGLDVTGGYIIKTDYWNNSDSWQSNYSPSGFPGLDVHFVYYYPKPDEIVAEQKTYIQNFMNDFETALYSTSFKDSLEGYRKYIHVNSFIDYFIINELARNVDGFKKSRFFYKTKDNADGSYGKLKAGPVWDFDWAFKDMWAGSEDGSGFMYMNIPGGVNCPGWYIRLMEDSTFANELHCRYAELRNSILSETYLYQFIDSISSQIAQSQDAHFLVWGNLGVPTGTFEVQPPSLTYTEEITKLKSWLNRRLTWLDSNMPGNAYNCGYLATPELSLINFEIYPNPFNERIEIVFHSTLNETVQIKLLDASGRIVLDANYPSENGLQTIQLQNLSHLSSGVYFLELTVGNEKVTKKIIK